MTNHSVHGIHQVDLPCQSIHRIQSHHHSSSISGVSDWRLPIRRNGCVITMDWYIVRLSISLPPIPLIAEISKGEEFAQSLDFLELGNPLWFQQHCPILSV